MIVTSEWKRDKKGWVIIISQVRTPERKLAKNPIAPVRTPVRS